MEDRLERVERIVSSPKAPFLILIVKKKRGGEGGRE